MSRSGYKGKRYLLGRSERERLCLVGLDPRHLLGGQRRPRQLLSAGAAAVDHGAVAALVGVLITPLPRATAAGALILGIHVVKAGRALLGDAARPDLRLRLDGLRGRQPGRHGDGEPANGNTGARQAQLWGCAETQRTIDAR